MNRKRTLYQVMPLAIGSLLFLIVAGSLRSSFAAVSPHWTKAEQYVLDQVKDGDSADFEDPELKGVFPNQQDRELRASFIRELLTNPGGRLTVHPHGISIQHAVISEELDLINQEIPYDVSLTNCIFQEDIDFSQSHFAKSIILTGSVFERSVDFQSATIDFDFKAEHCQFKSKQGTDDPNPRYAFFGNMRVAGDFNIGGNCQFGSKATFEGLHLGGDFIADDCQFFDEASFKNISVAGDVLLRQVRFNGFVSFKGADIAGSLLATEGQFKSGADFDSLRVKLDGGLQGIVSAGVVSFNETHFTDLFLNNAHFENAEVSFTRMQVDGASFDGAHFNEKLPLKLEGMTFRVLSPASWAELQKLANKSSYNAEFYSNLETLFRTHGDPGQADEVFIAKQRRERSENCEPILSRCRLSWAWSMFKDALIGYGKRLQYLLYWSLGFLIIGTFVFRSEKGMRLKDEKDAPHHAGRYNAFWYSLDLFLPIIKLGEADVWTPKDNRRWANLYRRVHIIIGSLFVPIGLAAWTGIIK